MHIAIAALHRPTTPTGVCRHAANLAQCLADTKSVSRVTLITGIWQKHYFKTFLALASDKIEILDIKIPNNSISRNLWFLFELPKLLKRLNPDIVHLSFPLPFVRSRFTCPVVSTIHDLYPYECPENFGHLRAFFNRYFLKQCVRDSDGLSCVSQLTLDRLKEFFPKVSLEKTLSVIYNYVDFPNILPKVPKAIEDCPEVPFLLCVAQHRKNKNLDLAIESYSLLLTKKQIDFATKLIIVGSSGPETKHLYDLIQTYNLQNRVVLLSSVEEGELCWLYQHCRLFVIPSFTEGFCIPLVEAFNFSCKVVCSDISIFREIGNSSCHYFDLTQEPIENLARTIVQSLQELSSDNGFKDSRFTKASVAEQYLEFYAKVLNYPSYVLAVADN